MLRSLFDGGRFQMSSAEKQQVLLWVQEELFLESSRNRLRPALDAVTEEVGVFAELQSELLAFLAVSENVTGIQVSEVRSPPPPGGGEVMVPEASTGEGGEGGRP